MDISHCINGIEADLQLLAQSLNMLALLGIELATLPPLLAGAETQAVQSITPDYALGAAALTQMTAAFTDLYIQRPYSQKASRRYVGYVHLAPTTEAAALAELVRRINANKAALQHYVVEHYATRGDRFRVIHDACPGVMTMHLYRQIHLLDEQAVQSLRFTWQKKEVVTCPDKKLLLEQIAAVMAQQDFAAQLPLQLLSDAIHAAPASRIRIRRPVKVQPAANVVCAETRLTLNAPLPIVVIQAEPFKLKMIAPFDGSTTRKPRSDKKPNLILGTFNGFQIERTTCA